jgi:spermidine dehydrogenase
MNRRDFLNGVGITIAAGISPLEFLRAAAASQYYPPALTGLRGSHPGSFEVAHHLGREGGTFPISSLPIEEAYDLVIVGGGISGLSAAWFYRDKYGADKKILILDNHDDFGGHAKRNEFTAGGRMIIGYGGTESMESPRTGYSEVATGLVKALGIDVDRFTTAFDRTFYASKGLSRGVFFDAENWREDKLVTGDPLWLMDDDQLQDHLNARPYKEFIADFPLLTAEEKAALVTFHESPPDYLAGMSDDEKQKYLATTSYRDFLLGKAKLSENAAKYFQGRFNDLFASSSDTVSCLWAMEVGFPGFTGTGLAEPVAEGEDPYISHFPDGNASIARLLVRSLVPGVAPGNTMDDIVLAPFDYSKLDLPGASIRIRLNSVVVNVANTAGGVDVGYVQHGKKLHRVQARKCILAGYNMMIPFIFPELPDDQKQALRQNVKKPLIYTNVVLGNWHSFMKAGVHDVYSPTSTYARLKLDYPVSLGGYEHPKNPDEPMCVHMYCALTTPNQGLDARAQSQIGRQVLLETPFDKLETQIRDQLSRVLKGSGFEDGRDIEGITVNRWPHGYSYDGNLLDQSEEEGEAVIELAKRPKGNVAIANSDAGWDPLTQVAIDEAWRAVNELG